MSRSNNQPNSLAHTCNQASESPSADTLCTPWGVALDATHHHLYVSDYDNNRELIYNLSSTNLPLDATADYVIGQNVAFDQGNCNNGVTPTAFTLCQPAPPTVDTVNHHLYIPDYGNSRVLVYNLDANNIPPDIATNADADHIYGQADGGGGSCNYDTEGATTTAIDMCYPYGVTLDLAKNHMWVADTWNSRVLIFETTDSGIPWDTTADFVYGQEDLTTPGNEDSCIGTYNSVAVTATGYCQPDDVVLDLKRHQAFVNDEYNHRILIYKLASATNLPTSTTPTGVIGASSLTAAANTGCNGDGSTTKSSLCYPDGPSFDSVNHRLFYTDQNNHRVLIFNFVNITTTSIDNARKGRSYSDVIKAANAQGTKKFSITSGSLPSGLHLSASTGEISGTPKASGSFGFIVKVSDTNGAAGVFTDTQHIRLTVRPAITN